MWLKGARVVLPAGKELGRLLRELPCLKLPAEGVTEAAGTAGAAFVKNLVIDGALAACRLAKLLAKHLTSVILLSPGPAAAKGDTMAAAKERALLRMPSSS